MLLSFDVNVFSSSNSNYNIGVESLNLPFDLLHLFCSGAIHDGC